MLIDIDLEELLHFQKASEHFPGTRKPAIQTLHRWRLKGLVVPGSNERVKLETIKISGLRYTSREAIRRFIDQLNPCSPNEDAMTPLQRKQQSDSTRTQLAEFGISSNDCRSDAGDVVKQRLRNIRSVSGTDS